MSFQDNHELQKEVQGQVINLNHFDGVTEGVENKNH